MDLGGLNNHQVHDFARFHAAAALADGCRHVEDVPDFYIGPAQWVRSDVKSHFATWLESRGGVRPRNPESDHSTVELDRIRQWHQRWDVLEGRADED